MELDSTLEGLNSNPRIIVLYSCLKHLYFHGVKSTRDFEKELVICQGKRCRSAR